MQPNKSSFPRKFNINCLYFTGNLYWPPLDVHLSFLVGSATKTHWQPVLPSAGKHGILPHKQASTYRSATMIVLRDEESVVVEDVE